MNKNFSILFIGNSYTYFNDMPTAYFAKEAEAAGYCATVESVTKGGAFLYQYADPESTVGKILSQKTEGRHYDIAVIQDQSMNPIINEERFLQGVGDVMKLIDAEKFILYATWGRNVGSKKLDELGLTTEEMTEKLSCAYNKAANLYGMRVAEVGKAFLNYAPRSDLYNEDNSHPSEIGSAIAARVIFDTVRHC